MIRLFKYILMIFFVLISAPLLLRAQTNEAKTILDAVQRKFLQVKEYEANVKIKVDVDFIKIPEKTGKIWFIQPDKIKVKVPGFALLPKRGLNFSPNQLFSGNYSSLIAREELLDNIRTVVIKVIPNNDADDLILATLWIDPVRNVIRKMESSSRNEGTFVMNFLYPAEIRLHDLPEQIRFDFDLRKSELPIGLTGDFENTSAKTKSSKTSRGTVTIKYLAYFVNEGKGSAAFRKK